MSFRRYEILLPTRYNDGTPVEAEKIDNVLQELGARFGGVTLAPETLRGVWFHKGQRFEELNFRLFVDVEDTQENIDFFLRYKEILKEHFRQLDIWIVSNEVRII
jgi:hypothetical protein